MISLPNSSQSTSTFLCLNAPHELALASPVATPTASMHNLVLMVLKIFTFCLQISRPSTSSESPEISLKSQNEAKDTKKIGTKVADRAKKRAWYNNLLYPSYKSRSEEAKKLFNLSDDERLVVGESNVNPKRRCLSEIQGFIAWDIKCPRCVVLSFPYQFSN